MASLQTRILSCLWPGFTLSIPASAVLQRFSVAQQLVMEENRAFRLALFQKLVNSQSTSCGSFTPYRISETWEVKSLQVVGFSMLMLSLD